MIGRDPLPLSQDQVDALPTGSVVTVLWRGIKHTLFTYRVVAAPDGVYCTELLDDGGFRPTQQALPLTDVQTAREDANGGTIVLPELAGLA